MTLDLLLEKKSSVLQALGEHDERNRCHHVDPGVAANVRIFRIVAQPQRGVQQLGASECTTQKSWSDSTARFALPPHVVAKAIAQPRSVVGMRSQPPERTLNADLTYIGHCARLFFHAQRMLCPRQTSIHCISSLHTTTLQASRRCVDRAPVPPVTVKLTLCRER